LVFWQLALGIFWLVLAVLANGEDLLGMRLCCREASTRGHLVRPFGFVQMKIFSADGHAHSGPGLSPGVPGLSSTYPGAYALGVVTPNLRWSWCGDV